ncbi:D site-binding protein [Pseudolycoriella hygida]|uniref:D site-binding protein n=1 Tax=Pseudolycoriella hygida TaxID=35572 RepID=A0A9Q0N8B0_9DIPT|nr:D site-binding protein [Pseudolycoriella hygida]
MCNGPLHRPNGLADPFSTFHFLRTYNRLLGPSDLSRYYNMAVMKDSKDRKFPLPSKPADILLQSTSSPMTHLLNPTYSTEVESLNNSTYTSQSPSRTVSSTTCAISPTSTIVDETMEQNFLLRESGSLESYQSMMNRRQRGEKRPIPNEQKDEKYFERRKRNNEAAKKSRDARKIREDRIAFQAAVLEQENAILRAQVVSLRDENSTLRHLLCTRGTSIPM